MNSGKVEKKQLLRWGLYVILGLIVAQSAWVIGSQSIAQGRYSQIVFMSVMIGAVIATIYLERKYRGVKFQFYHPWRILRLTTRGILWMIATFDSVVMGVFLVIVIGSTGLVFRDGSAVSLLQLPALLVVATVPYGYWFMRRRYELVTAGETSDEGRDRLRYTGYSTPPWRQRLIWAALFGFLALVFLWVFSSSLWH